MSYILPVFLFCMVFAASAEHTHEDVGEYGNYNTWRKAICEKNDQEMNKELDECYKLEHKNVQDASMECAKEVHPPSDGNLMSFVNSACEDPSIFIKFDICFEEYENNPAFREQMMVTPEIEGCYDKVMKKYKMGDLRSMLKDWPIFTKSR